MPNLPGMLAARAGVMAPPSVAGFVPSPAVARPALVERINIPYTATLAPPGLVEAETVDPWSQAGKYALGWVYYCIILLVLTIAMRLYNTWTDKIRTALYQDEVFSPAAAASPETPYEMSVLATDKSTNRLFPRSSEFTPISPAVKTESSISSSSLFNNLLTALRFVFYRPLPDLRLTRRFRPISFPSLAVVLICSAAVVFTVCYCLVPQPLYWQSIAYGSPPVAIRAGMLAVSMVPWLVTLSMKANLVSFLTGISPDRLNVLHRWGGWLCLLLSLIHTIPFYVQPVTDKGGYAVFRSFFNKGIYVYGTGFAALVPLCVLCIHSLPVLRSRMYELFVVLHLPISIVFIGMMFWHCNNYLTSWNYLFATVGIWLFSYILRLFCLNWTNPWRLSWLVGDEAAVFLMPENAVKVTIPTQKKWKPGQYVYLRMPGISIFENHPFTIASLCSDDFPSEYGEGYRDMILVFRPFKGFTRKVLESAQERGPWHTYRAFIDGPYGGMRRSLEAFDHVVLFAGGSGITALISHLLDLIKRMRDGKAVTKSIHIVWALKRPEVMEWFKEELRICREFAPPESVQCQFYITAAKRVPASGQLVSVQTPSRPMSQLFHDKVNNAFQDIAEKRCSHYSQISTNRHSALINDEAKGDPAREKELRRENEDAISALPQPRLLSMRGAQAQTVPILKHPRPIRSVQDKRQTRNLQLDLTDAANVGAVSPQSAQDQSFDFGFPSTPTEFQKNLMRFAFLPAAVRKKHHGWSTEYGRPAIPYMLRQMSKEFGKRTCVFVCGPPSMRVDVARTVAELQADILKDPSKDELYLHTENYAI